jgi:hypothetical protein
VQAALQAAAAGGASSSFDPDRFVLFRSARDCFVPIILFSAPLASASASPELVAPSSSVAGSVAVP